MITTTIDSGASLSSSVSIPNSGQPCRIQMPSAWTPAVLTFLVSNDSGVSYQPIFDGSGGEYTVVAAAGQNVILDPSVFSSINNFKIQSGTSSGRVLQSASRAFVVVSR